MQEVVTFEQGALDSLISARAALDLAIAKYEALKGGPVDGIAFGIHNTAMKAVIEAQGELNDFLTLAWED